MGTLDRSDTVGVADGGAVLGRYLGIQTGVRSPSLGNTAEIWGSLRLERGVSATGGIARGGVVLG